MAENDYAKLSTLGKVENIAGENKLRLKNGWWATLTSRAKNCHCERSEAIASFTLRLLRYARNDMSLIRKIRYQLAWDTTPLLRSYEISVVVISDSDSDSDAGVGYLFLEVGQ